MSRSRQNTAVNQKQEDLAMLCDSLGTDYENPILMEKLVNALPGGVAVYKMGETIETLYSSDGVPRLSGRTMEEYRQWVKDDIVGNTVYRDDVPEMLRHLKEAVSEGKPFNITYRLRHKDGSLVWVQLSASKIREEDGCQIYYAIYTRPTEETRLYESVVEESPTAVLVAERENRSILYANITFKNMLGLDAGKGIIGRRLTDIASETDCLMTAEELDSLSESEYRSFVKHSRHGRYIRIAAKAISWNVLPSYICYITDETEVQRSHNRMEELLDKIPGGVGIYEIRGGIPLLSYMNTAYYRMIGKTPESRADYFGESTIEAVYEEDRPTVMQAVKEVEQGNNQIDIHFRTRQDNGSFQWVRMMGAVTERTEDVIRFYACLSDYEQIMLSQLEMQSSRRMLDMALGAANAMVWRYDPYRHRITDSGSLGKVRCLPKEIDRVPECFIQTGMVCPGSIGEFRRLFASLPSKEVVTVDVEVMAPKKNGHVWERMNYIPVFDENGTILEEIGSSLDITEQKLAEQRYEREIQMQNELLRDALMFYQVNVTRRELEACRLMGYELERYETPVLFTRETWQDCVRKYVSPEYQSAYFEKMNMEHLQSEFENGNLSLVLSHFRLREELCDKWCSLEASLTARPGTGDVIAIVYIRDVDKEYKKQLTLDSIVDEETEFISLLDIHTGSARVIKVNPSCSLIPPEEYYDFDSFGRETIAGSAEPEEREACRVFFDRKKMVERLKTVETDTYTFCCMQSDGVLHRKKISAFYLDSRRTNIVIVRRDITDLFREEQEHAACLKAALTTAQEANAAKSDFLSRMSHDMRTPMNGILGLTKLLQEESDLAVIRENLAQIEMSGRYLLALINDTLDMNKIEAGRLELHMEPIDSEEVFSNIIANAQLMAGANGVQLQLSIPNISHGNWLTVRADASRIEQVLINVISNAIKFTPRGGTVELVMETISIDEKQIIDRYIIRDTGIGISEEFLPHIFEPFSQEGRSNTGYKEGTGLGMPIVKRLVDRMGGQISIKSRVNEGTEVTLLMKYERCEPKTVAEPDQEKENDLGILAGRRVLVCEDHPLNAKITVRLLEKQGMMADIAENGRLGLERFREMPAGYYDAILMDVRMPEMNGMEATQAIRILDRADAGEIPIIAMTANAFDSDRKNCLDAGMNAHLSKPVAPQLLYETLGRFLTDTGRQQE